MRKTIVSDEIPDEWVKEENHEERSIGLAS